MHYLKNSESTDINLDPKKLELYVSYWQEHKQEVERVSVEKTINLSKLGEYRSSRWYNSFKLMHYFDKNSEGFY